MINSCGFRWRAVSLCRAAATGPAAGRAGDRIYPQGQQWARFERLRLQYHLLPHNVYNFGQYPPAGAAVAGDFILVLGAIPGLSFDEREQVLRWPDERPLPAVALDRSRSGVLYRVREAADG